jgi:hypothetical protein
MNISLFPKQQWFVLFSGILDHVAQHYFLHLFYSLSTNDRPDLSLLYKRAIRKIFTEFASFKVELSRKIPTPGSLVEFDLYFTPFWNFGKEKVSGGTLYLPPAGSFVVLCFMLEGCFSSTLLLLRSALFAQGRPFWKKRVKSAFTPAKAIKKREPQKR